MVDRTMVQKMPFPARLVAGRLLPRPVSRSGEYGGFNLILGWHYLLDLPWAAAILSQLPLFGAKGLDVGAGRAMIPAYGEHGAKRSQRAEPMASGPTVRDHAQGRWSARFGTLISGAILATVISSRGAS